MKSRLIVFSAVVAAFALTAQADVLVYSTDFSTGAGPEWSNTNTDTTPGGTHAATKFLGQFGQGNAGDNLTLTGLAAHDAVQVTFDLYMIRSVDGNGQFGGAPDDWYLNLTGIGNLISTNFANFPGNTQQYPAINLADLSSPGETNASEVNTLGYTFSGTPMDSVYHIVIGFHSTGDLNLEFTSAFSEALDNESWGLDNVSVQTNADTFTPEPATLALFGTGLGLVGLIRRRFKA